MAAWGANGHACVTRAGEGTGVLEEGGGGKGPDEAG